MNKVFVYGTLKPGNRLYPAIGGFVEDSIEGYTAGVMYSASHRGFPYVVFNDDKAEPPTIMGFVLTFDPSMIEFVLRELDAIEGHPAHYKRVKIMVYTDDGVVEAWSYDGSPTVDKWVDMPEPIMSGVWE
jgi:gamma-glutamylcyclotransferase (GGCT)/AIG2-like uncharacterized protein YtfP